MDKIVLILIAVVLAYIVIMALKSTFNLIFKIAVIILALAFLGYNFAGLDIIQLVYRIIPADDFANGIVPADGISVNETITNETLAEPVNITVGNVTVGNISEINITAV